MQLAAFAIMSHGLDDDDDDDDDDNNNNNNKLQLGCHPVAVVILVTFL